METFLEYTESVCKRLMAEGTLADSGEKASFDDVVLHATPEERGKMGSLLIAEAVRQGENEEAFRKEWDTFVEAVLKGGAKRLLADIQPPTVEDLPMQFYHATYRPSVAPTYYSDLHRSKHQCTRKPKPRQRGVKHGNRKKKR